jgi:tetratricopeptide (TPR) repeat protein
MLISRQAALTGAFTDSLWKAVQRSLDLNQPDTVLYYLDKWLVVWPAPERQALACLKTALLLESGGHHREAAELLRKGLRREPEHPSLRSRLFSRLAFNLVQLGRPGEALPAARAAVDLRPDQAEPRLHLGLALEAVGQDARAAQAYRAGMEAPVLERELFTRAGELFFQIAAADQTPARQPAPLRLLAGICQLARLSGDGYFSEADLQARLWIPDPRWEAVYRPLLEVLILRLEDGESRPGPTFTGLLQQARPGVYQLSATGQRLKKAFFSPGPKPRPLGPIDGFIDPEGRMIFQDYLNAKQAYLRRLDFEIKTHLGSRTPEKAEPLVQQLVPLADSREEAAFRWLQRGMWREQAGDFQDALECYQEGLDCRPTKTETRYFLHNNAGYCLNRLGRHSEAESRCRKAINVGSDYHNAYKNLGLSLEGQGRWLEAAQAYRLAVRAWPGDRRAFDHLARLVKQHPGLALDHPELKDFLDAAAVVVEHARAIAAFADPEKKGPTLPVPLQLLVAAAQVTRDTGRKTFSPGELRKRLKIGYSRWLITYEPTLKDLCARFPQLSTRYLNYTENVLFMTGLNSLQFNKDFPVARELICSLVPNHGIHD